VDELILKMDKIVLTVDELSKVHKVFGNNYSREKAYAEEIDWAVFEQQERERARKEEREKRQVNRGHGPSATDKTQERAAMMIETESSSG
jgi:hypothetical protein